MLVPFEKENKLLGVNADNVTYVEGYGSNEVLINFISGEPLRLTNAKVEDVITALNGTSLKKGHVASL